METKTLAFRTIEPFQASQPFLMLEQTACQRFSSKQPRFSGTHVFGTVNCVKALNVIDRLPRKPRKISMKTLVWTYFSSGSPGTWQSHACGTNDALVASKRSSLYIRDLSDPW
jgi:hypothetical protein